MYIYITYVYVCIYIYNICTYIYNIVYYICIIILTIPEVDRIWNQDLFGLNPIFYVCIYIYIITYSYISQHLVVFYFFIYMGHSMIYPLVNIYITMERSTMLLMGKSTNILILSHFLSIFIYQQNGILNLLKYLSPNMFHISQYPHR